MSEPIDWPNLKLPPINLYNAPRTGRVPVVSNLDLANSLKQTEPQKTTPKLTQ